MRTLAPAGANSTTAAPADASTVELSLGLHKIEIDFTPAADAPAQLTIRWQAEQFRGGDASFARGGTCRERCRADRPFLSRPHAGRRSQLRKNATRPADSAPLTRQLASRPGPKLTKAGSRLQPAWIYHWLANPAGFRPEAVMPALFSDDERGAVERYAVAQFSSLSKVARSLTFRSRRPT